MKCTPPLMSPTRAARVATARAKADAVAAHKHAIALSLRCDRHREEITMLDLISSCNHKNGAPPTTRWLSIRFLANVRPTLRRLVAAGRIYQSGRVWHVCRQVLK